MKNIFPEEVKIVAFDAFDTLVHYQKNNSTKGKGAYSLLFENLNISREEIKKWIRYCMTKDISFEAIAELVRHSYNKLKDKDIIRIQNILDQEVESIKLYDDSLSTIAALQNKGYKIALISNLAKPYGEKLNTIIPDLDVVLYSYEVGYIKPDKEIFQLAAYNLSVELYEILMIGNHGKHDFVAPQTYTMQSLLLDRSDTEIMIPDEDKIQSLSELNNILTSLK